MVKRHFSLKFEFKLFAVLSVFTAYFVFALLFTPFYLFNSNAQIKENLKSLTTALSKVVQYTLYNMDYFTLRDGVNGLATASDIARITVYDVDKNVVAQYLSDEFKQKDDGKHDDDFISTQSEIFFNDIKVGSILISISKGSYMADYMRVLGVMFFSILVSSLLFWMFALFYSRQRLVRPINEFVNASKSFGKNLPKKVILSDSLASEWHYLKSTFNSMIDGIEIRDQELSKHAEELERIVEERTLELDQQRMKTLNTARMASLGEMAGGIAHEINNPLAIILGHSQMIRRKLAQFNKESLAHVENQLTKIDETVKRCSRIIQSLRTFARDGQNDQMQATSVTKIIEETMDLCQMKAAQYSVELSVRVSQDCIVMVQETQISQALVNLVNNAIDAISDLDERWITITSDIFNEQVVIAVIDSGRGIPESVQEKMMNPFFTTKAVGKGTGIGLSLSKGFIESNKGRLEYKLIDGHTAFTISLPFVTLLPQTSGTLSPLAGKVSGQQ